MQAASASVAAGFVLLEDAKATMVRAMTSVRVGISLRIVVR
jgi:hypothetical protein